MEMTMPKTSWSGLLILTPFCLALMCAGGCGGGDPLDGSTTDATSVPADRNALAGVDDPLGETVKKIVYLDQGWKPKESQRFYFTSQGSQIVPYDWFLALEQADGETPFRDNRNMLRFRYLVQEPDSANPDGLPVGFVKDEGRDREWLGVNCSACHTNQIDYKGVGYR